MMNATVPAKRQRYNMKFTNQVLLESFLRHRTLGEKERISTIAEELNVSPEAIKIRMLRLDMFTTVPQEINNTEAARIGPAPPAQTMEGESQALQPVQPDAPILTPEYTVLPEKVLQRYAVRRALIELERGRVAKEERRQELLQPKAAKLMQSTIDLIQKSNPPDLVLAVLKVRREVSRLSSKYPTLMPKTIELIISRNLDNPDEAVRKYNEG